MQIDVGIFAHNEATNIHSLLSAVAKQTALANSQLNINVHVLANGCKDSTVEIASTTIDGFSSAIKHRFQIHNFSFSGKSRTWNHFVHQLSDDQAEYLIFLDGDISIDSAETLEKLIHSIQSAPSRVVTCSLPIKDIQKKREKLNTIEKIIAASASDAISQKNSICGQLYIGRSLQIKKIFMPAGLPVEDGFLRAMILTDCFTEEEKRDRILTSPDITHTYESIRSLGALIKHQTRLVIGGAINVVIFDYLTKNKTTNCPVEATEDENWLRELVSNALPKRRYGYIPWSFATKRLKQKPGQITSKRSAMRFVGVIFDVFIYIIASVKMASGTHAGHW